MKTPAALPRHLKPRKKFIALLLVALIGLSAMAIGGAWFLYRMYRTLPTLDQLENIDPPLSSKVMGKDGTLVYEFSIEKRSWMSLNKIPAALVNAVLQSKTESFMITGASTSNGSWGPCSSISCADITPREVRP